MMPTFIEPTRLDSRHSKKSAERRFTCAAGIGLNGVKRNGPEPSILRIVFIDFRPSADVNITGLRTVRRGETIAFAAQVWEYVRALS